jgi:hypothetical protein
MIDAFMATIAPYGGDPARGVEGCLANSPYGDIYDVIVPNTPGGPVPLDVLANYKVAILLGKHPKSAALAQRPMAYVKAGGTLLINIKQLDDSFPGTFVGVEGGSHGEQAQDARGAAVKGDVFAWKGSRAFRLAQRYECERVTGSSLFCVGGRHAGVAESQAGTPFGRGFQEA